MIDDQVVAFEILISSFYNNIIKIWDVLELSVVTKLADYYCALPTFSRSLDAILRRDRCRPSNMQGEAVTLLQAAIKLRHADLFRDCVCFIAGEWDASGKPTPIYDLSDLEPNIVAIIEKYRSILHERVARVQIDIFRTPLGSKPVLEAISRLSESDTKYLPTFYRAIYKAGLPEENGLSEEERHFEEVGHSEDEGQEFFSGHPNPTGWGYIRKALRPLMSTKLRIVDFKPRSGEAGCEDIFLSTDVAQTDLPWPRYEKDW